MNDEQKTRAQLIDELQALRKEYEAARRLSAGQTAGAEIFYNIVANANDAIISIDRHGLIIFANRKAEEMYGYAAGEMTGKSSADLIPQESKAADEKAVSRHRQNVSGGLISVLREGSALRQNGTILPVEASYYGYHLNGKYFMAAVIRDISERKRIEDSLGRARDFSDNIIESSLDAIVIVDPKGNITRTNSAFLKLLGLEQQNQVIGHNIMNFSPARAGEYESTTGDRVHLGPDFFEAVQSTMSRLRQGSKICLMESYHLRSDKRVVPVEDTINPLLDEKGAVIGAVGVIRDITERKKAEKALADSRDFLKGLFDTSMEGLVVSDAQGYITMVNNKAVELLAYTKEELIGRHFSDLGLTLIGEEEKAKMIIEEFLTRGVLTAVERTWKRRDGSTIDVEMNIVRIKDQAGNAIGAMSSFRDIGLRKKADMALRISEERYRRIFDSSVVALLEIDISPLMSAIDQLKSGGMQDMRTYLQEHPEFLQEMRGMSTLIEANEAAFKLYGVRDKDDLMRYRTRYLTENSAKAVHEVLTAFAEGKPYFQVESVYHTMQGIQKHVLLQFNFLIKRRALSRLLMSVVDITDIKLAEIKLLEYQKQLRSLTHELHAKEETERRKLGLYLHDRIGQSLSVLKMQLEMMASEITDSDGRAKCSCILQQIAKTLQDTRVLSYELSPVILHEFGLEVALEWLAEQTQKQQNIAVTFKSDKKTKQLADSIKIILYRAVSELLSNVVKHARAHRAAVSIRRLNGQVQITVEDDGAGFDPSEIEGIAATERGFGLFSIKERLHYLGGSMHITSAHNQGTRITLTAPHNDGSGSRSGLVE